MALLVAGIEVFEVERPEKATRARRGNLMRSMRSPRPGRCWPGPPPDAPRSRPGSWSRSVRSGPLDGAVKDRTRAYSQLRDLATTAPDESPRGTAAPDRQGPGQESRRYRPDPSRLDDPAQATKRGLKTLATRIRALDAEIAEADKVLTKLTTQALPTLLAMPQLGVQTAAELAITAGQNIDRMHSEAAFAKLCGVAPIPASSGKTTRMRLNRGGDRQANSALYMVIIGRLAKHQPTREYRDRRAAKNKSNTDIIRSLKRYLARSTYQALRKDLMST